MVSAPNIRKALNLEKEILHPADFTPLSPKYEMPITSFFFFLLLRNFNYLKHMLAKSHQACLTLCDCIDWSPPGSFVHEILQARILEWVACPPSRGSSGPRDPTRISYDSFIDKQILYHYCHLGSPKMKMSGSQLCLTLRPHGLEIATLLCPWDSSGKNTGVGSHSFL